MLSCFIFFILLYAFIFGMFFNYFLRKQTKQSKILIGDNVPLHIFPMKILQVDTVFSNVIDLLLANIFTNAGHERVFYSKQILFD